MRGLLVVDPQIDFITGSLPVPGAREAMDALAHEIGGRDYAVKIVTLDFHPWAHSSFTRNGGDWPAHCVQWTPGAAVWPALQSALHESPGPVHYLIKGDAEEREEYSIFQNPASRQSLLAILDAAHIDSLDICGLAGDVCVLNTLRDGQEILGPGYFNVLRERSPSLDGGVKLRQFLTSGPV